MDSNLTRSNKIIWEELGDGNASRPSSFRRPLAVERGHRRPLEAKRWLHVHSEKSPGSWAYPKAE